MSHRDMGHLSLKESVLMKSCLPPIKQTDLLGSYEFQVQRKGMGATSEVDLDKIYVL
jgi:hypothetical protein